MKTKNQKHFKTNITQKLKFKKILFIYILFQFISIDIIAQNEEILHDRYWAYRERFRKHFTIIDKEPGSGLSFSNIVLHDWIHTHEVDNNGDYVTPAQKSANTKGKLNVGGDVTCRCLKKG